VQFPLADTQLIHRSMARGGVEPQTHRSSPAPRVPTNGRDVAHERMECPRAGSFPTLIPDSLVPSMGLVVLTQTGQGNAEVAGQAQGVGVVIAQRGTAQVPGALEQRPGRAGFPPAVPIRGRAVKQPGHVLLDPREAAVGIGGDQDVWEELAPSWPGRRVVPRIVGWDRGRSSRRPLHRPLRRAGAPRTPHRPSALPLPGLRARPLMA
jgi:hypothetical protein